MTTEIISFLQELVHFSAEIGIIIAEGIGVAILIITAVKSFVKYFRKDERIRLELAQGIALALEFKLGGEVLHTVTVSQDDWMALLFLGGIIALRGVLTLKNYTYTGVGSYDADGEERIPQSQVGK